MNARAQNMPSAQTTREQSISATIIRACRACGEPGIGAYEHGLQHCMRCGESLAIEDKGVIWTSRRSLGERAVQAIRRRWRRIITGGRS